MITVRSIRSDRSARPRRSAGALLALAALTGALVLGVPDPAAAADFGTAITARVSVTTAGAQISTKKAKIDETVLTDGSGRLVFFTTNAPLQADDVNGTWDVYVRDRVAGTTTRVSSKADGAPFSASASMLCGISTDGRFVGFFSPPTGSENVDLDQVWVLDRRSRQAEVVSLNSAEQPSGTAVKSGITSVGNCSLSSTGRFITFVSSATNLVPPDALTPGDLFPYADVFRRDRATGTTVRASVSTTETAGNDDSRFSSMSDDGNVVVFQSAANNLVAGDTNGHVDVFVRTIASGVTIRASVTDADAQVDDGDSTNAEISGNGKNVVFESQGSGLTTGEAGTTTDVYLRNLTTSATELVSVNTAELQANGTSSSPSITDDGRFVVFSSSALNLYSAKVTNTSDVFIRDRQMGRTDLASRTSTIAPGNGQSFPGGSASNDGLRVAFRSEATDLVRNDTNGFPDVFVRDFALDVEPFANVDGLIEQQFEDFAGRAPSGPEATEWQARLLAGEYSPDSAIVAFAHSGTWSAKRAPLTRLYWAFFLRTPDLGGMGYWVGRLDAGKSLASIAKQFAASSEFQAKYGSKTDQQFVTLIYQNIFDRDPDPGGLAYWTNKLGTKQKTRGDVMVNFSESSEGKRVLAPQTDVVLVWLGMMRTMPPKTVFTASVANIQAGTPVQTFAEAIRHEAEYAARVA